MAVPGLGKGLRGDASGVDSDGSEELRDWDELRRPGWAV